VIKPCPCYSFFFNRMKDIELDISHLRDGVHVLGDVLKRAREKVTRTQRNMAQLF